MLADILLDPFLQLYFVTILVSLLKYTKYFDSQLKYLPILLTYIFLTELLGLIIKLDPNKNPFITGFYSNYNYIIFYLYDFIFYGYFYYLFWFYTKNERLKKIIFIGSFLFILISIINATFKSIVTERQLFSYTFGGLLLIISAFLYILENFKKVNFKKSLLFWMSVGLIIFHIGYIPINITYSQITRENIDLYYHLLPIHKIVVFAMYACFIYGFIQKKNNTTNTNFI